MNKAETQKNEAYQSNKEDINSYMVEAFTPTK